LTLSSRHYFYNQRSVNPNVGKDKNSQSWELTEQVQPSPQLQELPHEQEQGPMLMIRLLEILVICGVSVVSASGCV